MVVSSSFPRKKCAQRGTGCRDSALNSLHRLGLTAYRRQFRITSMRHTPRRPDALAENLRPQGWPSVPLSRILRWHRLISLIDFGQLLATRPYRTDRLTCKDLPGDGAQHLLGRADAAHAWEVHLDGDSVCLSRGAGHSVFDEDLVIAALKGVACC